MVAKLEVDYEGEKYILNPSFTPYSFPSEEPFQLFSKVLDIMEGYAEGKKLQLNFTDSARNKLGKNGVSVLERIVKNHNKIFKMKKDLPLEE